uniref:SKP1 component dimerisation domain-containing protein n=1 Tax=Neobodo designis TaxID=312471 RepID=A0A7S1QW37_NEODS|mmetsp:Transcript_53506/g.164540  ORF Transcript_53506/g.164540 Transcript_53506/m.164540 type:complete len:224 (+) Transcript_53506:25-696(+)|eukprot:CAMPEP_0174853780 /NCGR_PEP_ID=MMETSP1114-20130205/29570_1 /TAXON_ID=312471 /ORGANISM="Neobodo designis, Strain CCAP 1951/1" /LENGTH=223 /DNA_ID=CAMNT_0016088447 /DNA_START=24 /DNA_END=695 /DNA_ORIENTATION=+
MASAAKRERAAALGFPLNAVRPAADPPEDVDWDKDLVVVSAAPPPDAPPPAALMDPGNEDELEPVSYVLSRSAVSQSALLKDLVASEEPGAELIVPVQGTATALAFAVAFMEYHAANGAMPAIDRPLRAEPLAAVTEFDRRLLHAVAPTDKEHLQCLDVMCVASYLGIAGLVDLTSAGIGLIMRGKSVEEVRDIFRIEGDLSPEELAEIDRKNQEYLAAYPDS